MRPILLLLLCGTVLSAQDAPFIIPTEEIAAIRDGKIPEEEAKKNWHGKRVEFTVTGRSNFQPLTMGWRAGQGLAGLMFPVDGKIVYCPAFFKGEKDHEFLKSLKDGKDGDQGPFKVRGTMTIDYKIFIRAWLENAEIVWE